MIRLLRSLFALYGILIFGVQLLIWVPLYWIVFQIFRNRADRILLWHGYHFVAPLQLALVGVFQRSKGRETVKKGGPHIIVSNHNSYLDILANARAYPGVYKFLSKKELGKLPLYGIIIRHLCILVDRKSSESRAESYAAMQQALADGFSVLLYPEGTRNRTAEPLQPFYDGAFRLASETGYPLAVVVLDHPGRLANPHRKLDLRPGIIDVTWSVISVTKDVPIEALKAEVRRRMLGALGAE